MADVNIHDSRSTGILADRVAVIPGGLSRVSWGAVFAGLVIATALQIVLTILGAAIGLTALDGQDNAQAFGIGAAIWAIAVPLITLFVGGMTAGRLANVRDRGDGFVHGALVWGMSLLLATWLLGTGASRIIGGTLNLAGNITGSAVSAVGSVAGNVASRSDVDGSDLQAARQRAEQEARARGLTEEEVQAEIAQVRERGGEIADQAQSVAAGSAWLALLALGLSLGAAAFGALRAVPSTDDHAAVRTA